MTFAMAIFEKVGRLLAAGNPVAAAAILSEAADAGDAEAMYGLANWRLFGMHGARDPIESRRLLREAAQRGHAGAIRLLSAILANGTGGTPDREGAASLLASIARTDPRAAAQLELFRAMPSEAAVCQLPRETVAERPSICRIAGFLSQAECAYIISAAAPELRASMVIDPATGRMIADPIRTSRGMSFGPASEDLVIASINRRIAIATGTAQACGEPLHALYYEPGQQYRAHVDTLSGVRNQRAWTVLLYLNSGYAGGQTRFEMAGVDFAGAAGDALILQNLDERGRPDPATRHAGLPLISGHKWIATRWIRQRDHDPFQRH